MTSVNPVAKSEIQIGGDNLKKGQHTWCENAKGGIYDVQFGEKVKVVDAKNADQLVKSGRAKYV